MALLVALDLAASILQRISMLLNALLLDFAEASLGLWPSLVTSWALLSLSGLDMGCLSVHLLTISHGGSQM